MATQTTTLYFLKTPIRFAYFAGHTYDVPNQYVKAFIREGIAREATKVLPKEVPARDKLIAAGFETIDDLKSAAKKEFPPLTQDEVKALTAYLYPKDSTEPESDLPEDFPGRDDLITAGITTIMAVKAENDITKVKGIGDATAEDIANYLND